MKTPTYRVDANVILRFLTGDPSNMAKKARQLMKKADEGHLRLRISTLILAETYWVLYSFYELSRTEIQETLSRLIKARGTSVENESKMIEALNMSAEENVDFVDAVLSLNAENSNETVVTFDESDFKELPGNWTLPEKIEI